VNPWSLLLGTYWLMKTVPFKTLDEVSVTALLSINIHILRITIIISLVLKRENMFSRRQSCITLI